MGVEIYPEFNPPVRGLIYEAEGKAIADNVDRIEAFSKKRKIRPVTDFLDNRDMPDDVDDNEEWSATRTDWYPAAEGLHAVQSLAQAIRSDPKAAERWNMEDPDGLETLLSDLDDLARCLGVAATRGAKFRLGVG
ncbi:MAG TPA: hypothetical protein VKE40_28170 [Gemmataceae bacterium]|nr:hypothetical protein [Gemmataceae bacterium]